MASLLQRLVELGRSHFHGLFTSRAPEVSTRTTWETEFEAHERTQEEHTYTPHPPGVTQSTGHGLIYRNGR